jgi:hypothetical protein
MRRGIGSGIPSFASAIVLLPSGLQAVQLFGAYKFFDRWLSVRTTAAVVEGVLAGV